MLIMSLVWLALGACLGGLALLARWTSMPGGRYIRWGTPALGAGAALAGGWLATLVLDHIFATFIAICVSIGIMALSSALDRLLRKNSALTTSTSSRA